MVEILQYPQRTLTLRTNDAVDTLIQKLKNNDIDIACIQETHNNRNDHIGKNNYTIIFNGEINNRKTSNEIIKAGTSIAIKTKLTDNIIQLNRINSRVMEIRLRTGGKIKNISILNTYAPDMSHNEAEHET